MRFKNKKQQAAVMAKYNQGRKLGGNNNNNTKEFTIGGAKPFSTDERVFFAPNKDEAIKHAKKVNQEEGYEHFNVDSIRLANKQNPNTDWKTWTFTSSDKNIKPVKKLKELEYDEFSKDAKKGCDEFDKLTSNEMNQAFKSYKVDTGKRATNIYNKEHFYTWLHAQKGTGSKDNRI